MVSLILGKERLKGPDLRDEHENAEYGVLNASRAGVLFVEREADKQCGHNTE